MAIKQENILVKLYSYQNNNNMLNEINLQEFKNILSYLIDNNKRLVSEGKYPIAINICGSAGIGKTESIKSYALERGMTFVKLNLAEVEEIGDIVGFPIKEFKINELDENGNIVCSKWVAHDLLSTYFSKPCETYEITSESRMSYATPAWLPREYNPNGTILLLDDYTRANSMFQQAIMELICTGRYISWELPKDTTLCLSSNPDDGSYMVTSLDEAQLSRLLSFNIKFDIDNWAYWAESAGLDSRGQNFLLSYPEILESVDGVNKANARSYTMFINAISGINDWSKPASLALILNISKGCFPFDKDNIIGGLFTTFINNKLDKLITPEDMLLKSWGEIRPRIEECVYNGDEYRPEIASILSTRLLNYSCVYFGKNGAKTDVVLNRLLELINAPKTGRMLFSEDFLYNTIKVLVGKFPSRTNKFIFNKDIRDRIR